ncbi:MAG: 2-hydroxychromene-2-carboxylate isomerase [Candidatus Azotimanducaceae bacterium]|jgi:2-hydroxychromene-2-carboxylate isomerase
MKIGTKIKSVVISFLAGRQYPKLKRFQARLRRRGLTTVHYFHQVDDPYSHLALQKLSQLADRYDVDIKPHLAAKPTAEEQGDETRFGPWAVRDARSIAAFYGTNLPEGTDRPATDAVLIAQAVIAQHLNADSFSAVAIEVGECLWRGESAETIKAHFDATMPKDARLAAEAIAEGTAMRSDLGHWLSGTFYFEGEWYWGVDRLVHLENRLCDLGLSNHPAGVCVPRPIPTPISGRDASDITLEYFPSLRSPYSAISFDRTIDLAKRSGVKLHLRPVMPMMMRGVQASRNKQLYILTDTRREADYYDNSFGRIVDPIGEPVRRGFALFPFMESQGTGIEYCSRYLKAAWAHGVDITTDKGLRSVVEACDVSWHDASQHFDNEQWQPLLESNVADMLDAGLWGVPSFRVSGGSIIEPFACWGQDRLWRVETDIAQRTRTH